MKTLIATSVLTALLISGVTVMAQNQNEDYLGLPGDNLNLFAVMNLFQESKTLEEFERNLNDENTRINNLDLNGDNQIDYINVFDNVRGNVHNIVLQVAVNKREKQDVAVFTVERDKKGNVMIQLTGDEALYGENYIIEPVYDDVARNETPNPGYTGNATTVNGREVVVVRTTTFEIAAWPLITYIYDPGYVEWRSSWYWGYYPAYWSPWRPYYWHFYYGYHYNYYDNYYAHYRHWNHHRDDYWHDYYYNPHHAHSDFVSVNVREGHYKSTYSHPEERKKGEALYASSHRDSDNRRTESVRAADQSRRTSSSATTGRSSGSTAGTSSRRSESSGNSNTQVRSGNRAGSERKSNEQVRRDSDVPSRKSETNVNSNRSSETKTYSQTRSSENRSSANTRTSEGRPSTQARTEERKPSTQVKSSASGSRETSSKSASPERRESRPKQEVKKESQPKPKDSETKGETRRR